MKTLSVHDICMIGMFTALLAVLSLIAIPTPWGIPFTLQTFVVALSGFVLGKREGTKSVILYIIIGLIGLPVYAGMNSGPGVLFGIPGGFLWGFIGLAWFCGIARDSKHVWIAMIGVLFCHLLGVIQMIFVLKTSFYGAFLIGSAPYLLKDILSVLAAYMVSLSLLRYRNIRDRGQGNAKKL